MFTINTLPARFGDSLWIEYGDAQATHRILIDGGTKGTRHDIRHLLDSIPPAQRYFELLVITHFDRDHIEGILALLDEVDPGFGLKDVWFNGWSHLPDNPQDEYFGAIQGERLTQRIIEHQLPWNDSFGGMAVVIPDDGPLPQITLAGGIKLTLVSPTYKALAELRPVWEQEVRLANLDPGFGLAPNDESGDEKDEIFGDLEIPDIIELSETPFEDDATEANGSSIAFITEFEQKRVLFAADAHADILLKGLERFSPGERVSLDLFKVSHHGSKYATSRELIEKVNCSSYLFSTNGSNYQHPHAESVARILVAGGDGSTLYFNYRSTHNKIWDLELLKSQHNYSTCYPQVGKKGIEIPL